MNRRSFLQACLLLSAAGRALGAPRRLAPVLVDPSRLIRTVVGLRHFREGGFRVEAERLGGKTLVHNYGHGGAGLTLSWGSAELAADLAWRGPEEDYAILGCGVMGLTTARVLQTRGGRVTLYARDLPPHTTSNIAGGQWGTAYVVGPHLGEATRRSWRALQDYVGPLYGVDWLDNYFLSEEPPNPERYRIYANPTVLAPAQSPFAGRYAMRITTMMIEPAVYLNRLLHDVLEFGGKIVVRTFARGEVGTLDESVVVNCTGLGSRELFGDEKLVPIRGQLHILLPQPEIDYAYLGEGVYMFPRQDGIVLGGTHERGDFSLEPNLASQEAIFAGHRRVMEMLTSGPTSCNFPDKSRKRGQSILCL